MILVNIENELNKSQTITDLGPGTLFEYNNKIYIKICILTKYQDLLAVAIDGRSFIGNSGVIPDEVYKKGTQLTFEQE